MITGLRTSLGLFTALPVGRMALDRSTLRTAMILAPLAVLPIAVIAAGLGWLLTVASAPAPAAGLIMVAALAIGTRALHLDGLADTVDAFGSGWDSERALAIMRQGDIGPMGVIALIIAAGLQALGYGLLVTDLPGAITAVVIICVSRTAVLIGCARPVPAARPEGLGAMVAGLVPVPVAVIGCALGTAMAMAAGGLLVGGVLVGAVAALAAYAACLALVAHAVRRLGGITGDVLGAAVEITATVLAIGMILNY